MEKNYRLQRNEELLNSCIGYIDEYIDGYYDMINTLKNRIYRRRIRIF